MRAALKALVLPAALLVAAEAAVRISGTTSQAIAAPTAVAVALAEALADGSMLTATRDTLFGAFAGLAIGSAIGLALGVLLGLVKPLDRLMEITIEAVRPIPSVAVIPIAMLALGFGYGMEIAIVAFACLWPMLILSRSAITGIEPRLLEVARALRLSPLQRVFKIVLPAALPRIIVAFRLAAGIALVVAVTVEIAANPLGLGYGILIAQQSLRPELMLAYLLWIGVVGLLVNALLAWGQSRLFGRAALATATS
ncbi:MAG TPA: ABC transporter permease subunit [Rhizobiaceae bacterium]|nr:ABC transporter permease subunit [Rhizobiaceae bacterium]